MLVTLLNNPAFSPAHIATSSRRCAVRASESAVATREDTFAAKKAALIAGLEREYRTFFQPMETELYSPDVEFVDPLINLNGVDAYANNVGMLAGSTLAGKILFRDCDLIMHRVTEPTPTTLETRWTLQFRFQLLPWAPLAEFTGVSKYTLDENARVVRQDDFWDSVNLSDGEYAARGKLAGLADMLRQFAPPNPDAPAASTAPLLRRAAEYEVRRVDGAAVAALRDGGADEARLRQLLARDGLRPAERRVASGIELEEHVW